MEAVYIVNDSKAMSGELFNQQFVHCAICHKQSSRQYPLYLTSCAHILCSEHLGGKVCTICKTNDVLAIKLEEKKEMPDEIKTLFQPIPSMLESLYNASQFQITGLINQCHYYKENCLKLSEKCGRQRELLLQAKQELDSVVQLESKIQELESCLRKQKRTTLSGIRTNSPSSSSSTIFTQQKPPDTVDLTTEESLSDKEEKNFIERLKITSSLRNKLPLQKMECPDSADDNSCIAESTHLGSEVSAVRTPQGGDILPVSAGASPKFDNLLARSCGNHNGEVRKYQSKFPSAIDRLRIVKRNNTFSNHNASLSRGSQGLVHYMRIGSSSDVAHTQTQTQTNFLMRKGTKSQVNKKNAANSTGATANAIAGPRTNATWATSSYRRAR